mmetsp:Transcript_64445/g.185213  ORF Transcript_64445/g.185213 Transcript_64445/m.185213 type:complete len:331 (-) Transcript_64445:729-1721(-)
MSVFAYLSTYENFAARHGHFLAIDFFLSRCSHDADICSLYLSATIWASSPVDADRSVDFNKRFKFLRQSLGIGLGLDKSQTAELSASTTDNIPLDQARIDLQALVCTEARFFKEPAYGTLVNIWQNCILFDGEPNFATAIFVGQVRQLSAFSRAETSCGHKNSNSHLSFLLLRVNTQELSTFKLVSGSWLLIMDFHTSAIAFYFFDDSFLEAFDPIFFNQPHQPRLLPVFAFTFVTEDSQDGFAKGNDGFSVSRNPHARVDRLGHPLDRHISTQNNVETHFSSFCMGTGLKSNIVDVSVSVVVSRSTDSNVEFPRQISPDRVPPGLSHWV